MLLLDTLENILTYLLGVVPRRPGVLVVVPRRPVEIQIELHEEIHGEILCIQTCN